MTHTLVDTGPLVALFDGSDTHHEWVKQRFDELHPPLHTCEPVITEAVFLMASKGVALDGLWALLRLGALRIEFSLPDEFDAVARLMRRYSDIPMDLADACLVRMSELRKDVRVFTLDTDFKFYRQHGRQMIPLIIPAR